VPAVKAYLAAVPRPMRLALESLRATIRSAAPGAQELIRYGIPAFRQDGLLVYYAAFRDHASFFVGSLVTQRRFRRELGPFLAGPGTVHFTPERPLPARLVTRIVKARVAENEARRRHRRARSPRLGTGRPRATRRERTMTRRPVLSRSPAPSRVRG
jgi:uncharacterized protein YdhG (YjbR/CyaY superfamily)